MEWSVTRVRSEFVKYFVSKGHTFYQSSAVIPHDDPTLLFANSGMAQVYSSNSSSRLSFKVCQTRTVILEN